MKILVIGGTLFLGRSIVESALERGHELVLFHRGKTNRDLFADRGVESVFGDRRKAEDLDQISELDVDAVIDPSAYFPRDVSEVLDRLDPATHYTFVSSISVYTPDDGPGADESSPVGELTDDMSKTEITGENYGPLKAEAERIARERTDDKALIVRPGLIVGPHDPSDRFTYWVWRIAQGGEIVAPGDPESPVQFIDVRDLADWMVRLVEQRVAGTFNATGPVAPTTMGDLLGEIRDVVAPEGTALTWVSEDRLKEADVQPYTEMPLWLPDEVASMNRTSIERAIASGLRTRPVAETIADTRDWFATVDRSSTRELRAGGGEEKVTG